MSQENVATSKRGLEEGFNRGNLSVIDEDTTKDFVSHDPLVGDQDRDASKQGIVGYRQAFPDLHLTIEDIFAADDKVVIRWSVQGTFENEFMGLKPTHEVGDPVRGTTIDRYEGGKIAESWSQWDTLTFMRNIGAIPEQAPASAGS
ncbi:MAG TPA: ester cyclase [Solirubrobacterales bacterium]|nr:ester cyclase [Solirubrobacterales bacterium]